MANLKKIIFCSMFITLFCFLSPIQKVYGEDWAKNLKPKLLWQYFNEITKIPRPSKNESEIRNFLISLAKNHNFNYQTDKIGNLLVNIPPTKGYQNKSTIVLQTHMDMETVKEKTSKVDPEKDPLDVYSNDEWIMARGTTLGADNGVGMAAALAIVDDKKTEHGPLELLFTVEEESGLDGAKEMDETFFQGKKLINLDGEKFGILYIGSAAARVTNITIPLKFTKSPQGLTPYSLKVSGLKGGHSGMDIILNRANANKILAITLQELVSKKANFYLVAINGHESISAIPREVEADILLSAKDLSTIEEIIKSKVDFFKREYSDIEDNITIDLLPLSNYPSKIISREDSERLINIIITIPNGIKAMSRYAKGSVETSTNLGRITTKEDTIEIKNFSRSSIQESLDAISSETRASVASTKAKVDDFDDVPAWKPKKESELNKIGIDTYKKLYGNKPEVTIVHAGLECSIFAQKIKGIDMISIGPDIENAHSPNERVNIKSTENFYNFLKYFLKRLN